MADGGDATRLLVFISSNIILLLRQVFSFFFNNLSMNLLGAYCLLALATVLLHIAVNIP